ncbi:CorA metal ion transporter [Entomophthora muscae]|uniref:CorA metal ion transporter n=1 Tax=Entomophthora muscae TaxID=34485 RepID=A0ACC2UHD3_9FUNG|nr:CorA metal ion transporter [Entomophthora muscae]
MDESSANKEVQGYIGSGRPEDDVCFPLDQEKSGIDLYFLEEFLKQNENTLPSHNDVYIKKPYESNELAEDGSQVMFYSKNTGAIYARTFSELTKLRGFLDALYSRKFWLDVTAANEAEMKALSRIFRIHPLTVEDILHGEVQEKCEVFRHYYFLSFRTYEQNADSFSYLDPSSIYNVVFKESIISFHSKPLCHITSVLNRIQQLKDFIIFTADWINYAIIDDITDSFAPMMQHIEFEVDAIDDLVLILKESELSDMLRRIGFARRKVTVLLRLLTSKPDVLKALALRCEDRLKVTKGPDIKLYLGDIQDHLITMVQNSLHYEKVLARAHSNYLAQISIELTKVSNRTNDAIAKLTTITSVFLPMSVITGLWGMNVYVPGQSSTYPDNHFWFFGLCTGMIFAGLITLLFVRDKGLFS